MQLLHPADHPLLQDLVSDAPHDLAVSAIAAQDASGRVFVEDPRRPRVALVSPHWGRLYLLGRPSAKAAAEVRRLIEKIVKPEARSAGAWAFTLAYPADWQPFALELLGGKAAVQSERQYYRWAGGEYPLAPLPEGFTVHQADAALLDSGLAGLELLREEMASERTSVDDFLARSFGIVAAHEGRLAGWCLSEYNTGRRCEVGIASLEPFQRQGLATAMGHAFLDMARDRGIAEVGWHCWRQNVPSAAAALKIGLEHVADYAVCFGWYNEADAPH